MRWFLSLSFVCLGLVSEAAVSYTVQVDAPAKKLVVTVEFAPLGQTTTLRLPNWSPGAYSLSGNGSRIKDLAVFGPEGQIPVDHPDATTWTFENQGLKSAKATYSIDQDPGDNRVHFSGPGTYLYLDGRKTEPCSLRLDLPAGWDAYCGLDPARAPKTYAASGYDELADNPVSVGVLVHDTYVSHGVPHTIVYQSGDPSKLDRGKVVAACKFVSDAEGDFFGGLPFKRYVWHFTVFDALDGGWGLEHLTSTQIGLATGLGNGTKSVLAHEYFHAWNVKRIRSSALGPFDYTKLPKTGALWWLEGVTDYYASLLTFRYGMFGEDQFFNEIVKNVERTRSNAARLEVSPYDSSYRVGDANNGRGNSSGFGVNYYNTGWLLGLCFDIELRSRTGGKRSLDDVMTALWRQCRNNQPGFPEDGIRQALVQVGGAGMGPLYDTWVMRPGELPVESELAKVGLSLAKNTEVAADLGFDVGPSSGALVVRSSRVEVLKAGDTVLEVNGTPLNETGGGRRMSTWNRSVSGLKPGDTLTVKYDRNGTAGTAEVKVGSRQREVFKVAESRPTPEQSKLREGWYRAGKKRLPYSP